MVIKSRQRLFQEEEKMNLARYYHEHPLQEIDAEIRKNLYETIIPEDKIIQPEHFTDWLLPAGKYMDYEMGCCLTQSGIGYAVTSMQIPDGVQPQMIMWFLKWVGIKPRGSVRGHGNLKYKIWNPADHFDHHFVNWTDEKDGVFSIETMDMGAGDRQSLTIRRSIPFTELGLAEKKQQDLRTSGCVTEQCSTWESLDEMSSHVMMSQIRPGPDGRYERRSVRWVGVRPENGKLSPTKYGSCSLEYLRKISHHSLVEWQHLMSFLPQLYQEYKDKSLDAD